MASKTETNLIAATQQLMLKHGYAGTGIMDICRQAGVSKGAFYHSFDSKEALALAALDEFYRAGLEALLAVDVRDVHREEQLIAFVDRVAEIAPHLWEHGCLIGGLASEMALASDPLQQSVATHFQRFTDLIAELAGPFAASLAQPAPSASELAEEFLAVVEGAIVLSRAHRDPTKIRAALQRLALHLRNLPRA